MPARAGREREMFHARMNVVLCRPAVVAEDVIGIVQNLDVGVELEGVFLHPEGQRAARLVAGMPQPGVLTAIGQARPHDDDQFGAGFSDALEGIAWVVFHARELNIRVMNLSLAAQSTESWLTDPLCIAVRRAAAAGAWRVTASLRERHGSTMDGG